ncbi:MAG: hypothetical protein JXO22_01925, partial [Phycisphaerae bacterium]|nr:hypothetical protein [Phycisphaerae bacterium]
MSNLTNCPRCNYSLRGLPARHTCPECGLAYDEESRVWRPRHPWTVHIGALGIALLLLPMGSAVLPHLMNGLLPPAWPSVGGASVLIGAVVVFVGICSANSRGRCVAVMPDGLFVRTVETERLVDWADIKGARRTEHWVKEQRGEVILYIDLNDSRR